jgi:AcrR family transcriptional regulator
MSRHEMTKKDQLIATGRDLFFKFGFKRVSVEEICKTAGVSKMTYYKHFSSKTDLLKVILDGMTDEQMNRYRSLMKQDIPYAHKVREIIRMKQDQAALVSRELFQDLYNGAQPELIEYLHQVMAKITQEIRNDFITAREEGHLREDVNPDFILYMLNHMIDLARDPRLTQIFDSHNAMIDALMQFFFYGILTREDKA